MFLYLPHILTKWNYRPYFKYFYKISYKLSGCRRTLRTNLPFSSVRFWEMVIRCLDLLRAKNFSAGGTKYFLTLNVVLILCYYISRKTTLTFSAEYSHVNLMREGKISLIISYTVIMGRSERNVRRKKNCASEDNKIV